jgi:predicted MFS family arabinose efflux permease
VDVYSYLVWQFSPHISTPTLRLQLVWQLREAVWVSAFSALILIPTSNNPAGGVIYPIVFHRLQPQIGFAWTTRVIGFMILATLAVPLTVLKVRVVPAKKRKLVDLVAFTEPAYVLFILGGMVTFMGLYVPFFYIQYFSTSTGVTDSNLGFYLLAILNTASVAGRIIPNFIADKTGPFNMIVPCGFAAGVIIFGLIGTQTVTAIIIISILYGFFSGTFVSLPPACFVLLSPNRGLIGTRMGMGFAIISIGGLIGTPIAGVILNANGWVAVWAYAGATATAGSLLMGASRMVRSRGKLIMKV